MKRFVAFQVATTAMKQIQRQVVQLFLVYVFCFETLSGEEISDEVRQNQPGIEVVPV